jgi:hypothetical protein
MDVPVLTIKPIRPVRLRIDLIFARIAGTVRAAWMVVSSEFLTSFEVIIAVNIVVSTSGLDKID